MDEGHAANLLGALSLAVTDNIFDAIKGISGTDKTALAAMLAVCERPGQSIGQLSNALELTHSTAVRVVDRLTALGFVRRGRGSDGRTVGLQPTEEAKVRASQVLAARRERIESILQVLPHEQQAHFESLLSLVLSSLPRTRTDAWHICRFCDHRVCQGSNCPVGSAVR